jgi:tripartite-type tricarboxylate transporter receptor subunit TctC
MKIIQTLAVIVLAAIGVAPASAQNYPNKPIKLIVSTSAGGITDILARILGHYMTTKTGQPIVIDNRVGASGNLAMDAFAKAAPDGYTLGIGPIGALAISPNMVPKLPYVIAKDLQPIALIVHGHLMLVVSAKSDIKSVNELIAKAKANPGKLTNASSANGSPGHVGGELFKYMTGTQIQHVPYRGGAAATSDLIAGHVDLMFESLNSISPMAKSGEVRGLGVSGDKRSKAFPDIPTIAEAGVPGYSAPTWTGLIGPAGMPQAVLEKLNTAVNRAIQSPGFIERFSKIGDESAGGTPQDFVDMIAKDTAKWKDVVARSGAKLD